MSQKTTLDNLFHAAWTRCVDKPGYNKQPWMKCQHQLEEAVMFAPVRHEKESSGNLIRDLEAVEAFVFNARRASYSSTTWGEILDQLRSVLDEHTAEVDH